MSEVAPTRLFTERLIIRRATLGDASMLYALWHDPRVMEPFGYPKGMPVSKEEISQRIEAGADSLVGSILIAELKNKGPSIGECTIMAGEEAGVLHTQVKLFPAFWGHGYGLEITWALLDYIFTHTNTSIVQSTPNISHLPAVRLQEAMGSERVGEGTLEFPEELRGYTVPVPHYIYRLTREKWLERRKRGLDGIPMAGLY